MKCKLRLTVLVTGKIHCTEREKSTKKKIKIHMIKNWLLHCPVNWLLIGHMLPEDKCYGMLEV